MLRFSTETLHCITHAVCRAAGSDPREADLVADHLVEANLIGHDSHGIGMLRNYVEAVRQGCLVPSRHAQTVSDRSAILVLDGERGYGRVLLPGKPERLQRAARLASGIEIDPMSWAEIGQAALAAGLSEGDWDGLTA